MPIFGVSKTVSAICTLLCLASIACSDGPSEPTSGVVVISTRTTGGDQDNGYQVSVADGLPRFIAADGLTNFTVPTGPLRVSLDNVAPNCEVAGDNPRTVDVDGGSTLRVAFEIACMMTGVKIRTITTGVDRAAQYMVTSSGFPMRIIGSTDSVVVSRIVPGIYRVTLTPPSNNCSISPSNEVSVEVKNRSVTTLEFQITCVSVARPEAIAFVVGTSSPPYGVIETAAPDGSNVRVFVPGNSPAWSPDGKKLAFSTWSCDYEYYYYTYCGGGVIVFDPETGASSPLPEGNLGTTPSWSPSGDRVVFARVVGGQSQLNIATLFGQRNQIFIPGVIDVKDPAWSPDGTRIAFACRIELPAFDLCVVNPDGTGFARLTHDPHSIASPAWSPDGQKIAFTYSAGTSDARVAVIKFDSDVWTILPNGSHPSWSPDGSKIVFAGADGLFTMNAEDGSNVTRLTTGIHSQPAWRR